MGRVLEVSRISVAWIPVGICMGAFNKTIDYVKQREAFGASLASNQLIQGTKRKKDDRKQNKEDSRHIYLEDLFLLTKRKTAVSFLCIFRFVFVFLEQIKKNWSVPRRWYRPCICW